MEDPHVVHRPGARKGSFDTEREGTRLGTMTYSLADGVVTIHHTEVDESLQGTGAGARMVEAAVEWARAEGLRIRPRCPFARAVFDRRPEYRDVMAL
jgi:uncharacterized protein